MLNARLDEAQAGIKIARRNINNLRYADDTALMAESKEELKSLLMKVRGERIIIHYVKRNLYVSQEATVTTRCGTNNWFKIGKGVHQGCTLSPCLFNL